MCSAVQRAPSPSGAPVSQRCVDPQCSTLLQLSRSSHSESPLQSNWQAVQPSKATVLPSSHCSVDGSTSPSPQRVARHSPEMQTLPGAQEVPSGASAQSLVPESPTNVESGGTAASFTPPSGVTTDPLHPHSQNATTIKTARNAMPTHCATSVPGSS